MSASAFNIYQSLWSFYGSEQLPKVTDASGVFFGFPGYTVEKLLKTVEALKGNSKGWFTSDFSQRNNALNAIASELAPGFGVDPSAIVKFGNWCYSWAKKDSSGAAYFGGNGDYTISDVVQTNVIPAITNAAETVTETVKTAISYPSIKSLLGSSTFWKIGGACALGFLAYKLIDKKLLN